MRRDARTSAEQRAPFPGLSPKLIDSPYNQPIFPGLTEYQFARRSRTSCAPLTFSDRPGTEAWTENHNAKRYRRPRNDDRYTDRKLYFSRTTQEFTVGLRQRTIEKHAKSPYHEDMRKTWDMTRYRAEMRRQQEQEGSQRKSEPEE